ncbi:uncharacterized protein BDZ99DRAFT_378427 [Mytilinidion resinicola]|uniref:DUF6594 domain-containing protein n=1 Tax=Mytilinidion resinicola TaxID=574789 RepID=A0A6A6Z321_9PEZI|nr:uncharacterized protein BDZ99DRAFT_378427 [Mytilinidion resinicola]KAF2815129.1 hypothetical protein BDZ99DRAFT_378427 [Mytilinidion resinicola]
MTGDTFVPEKRPFDSQSPTSPTDTIMTGDTMRGDAIIDIQEGDRSSRTSRTPSVANTSSINETPLPEREKKTFMRKLTGPFKGEPEPEDVTETNTRILENTPNGFPRLAAFQSSEANFALYRSFSYLHSRVLLDLQDEITCLEKELDDLDWDDFDSDPDRLQSREIDVAKASRDDPDRRNRRTILGEIRTKLMEYDEVLIKARTLESFQRPSDRNYRSVRRYHHNTKPLMDSEMDSIRSKEDIISLRDGREWASFDGGVESMLQQTDRFLKRLLRTKEPPLQAWLRTPELQEKTKNKYINFYSSSRVDKFVGILITFVIFVLLVLPIMAMYRLTTPSSPRSVVDAVGVLIVFTLLFSAAMSMLTKAARHELFAASAAYCAILVVFIGNFSGPNNLSPAPSMS